MGFGMLFKLFFDDFRFCVIVFLYWQFYTESSTCSYITGEIDTSFMKLCHLLGQQQSYAAARLFGVGGIFGPVEAVEQFLLSLWGDSYSVIGNFDGQPAGSYRTFNPHISMLASVFYGIG